MWRNIGKAIFGGVLLGASAVAVLAYVEYLREQEERMRNYHNAGNDECFNCGLRKSDKKLFCNHNICNTCFLRHKGKWICAKCHEQGRCGICRNVHNTNMQVRCCNTRFSFDCLQMHVLAARDFRNETPSCPNCKGQLPLDMENPEE